MPHKRSISIIVPNYNGKDLLEKYLPSTFKAVKQAATAFEVIVVDDASSDNSVEFLSANYPEIKVIKNSSNRGFSYTCNQGIKMAKNELVLLLNSDVRLEENYFEPLWKYFDAENTFGVMGRIVNSQGKLEDAARMLAFQGVKFKATKFFSTYDRTQFIPTAYLSGANALLDRDKLLELGGFDEIYSPFYVEDVDLSFRAWRMGWKCFYENDALCHHEVSSTTKKVNTKKQLYPVVYRNKFILQEIHLDGVNLAIWQVQLLVVEVFLRLLIGKWWIIKAYRDYLKQKSAIKASKVRLQQLIEKHHGYESLFDIKKSIFSSENDWNSLSAGAD